MDYEMNNSSIGFDPKEIRTSFFAVLGVLISMLALVLLYFFLSADKEVLTLWVGRLPVINVVCNISSIVLLLLGVQAIRKGLYKRHFRFVLAAFVMSAFFLTGYLLHSHYAGDRPFAGEGFIRPVYFTILITHIILSAFVVPLVLTSFYFAVKGNYRTHRKVAKITVPVWLYVSFTGVIIFFMLRAFA